MKTRNDIEAAVCNYYKVALEDIYVERGSKYPIGVARKVLIYFLYAEGYKAYAICEWFDIAQTLVYRYSGEIQSELKSDTKIKEDIENIKQRLKKQYHGRQ